MKRFTTEEIIDLLNQVYREEICFSIMVDILNDMVSESEVSEFKDGDFVAGLGCVFILHKQIDEYSAQYHVLLEIAYTKTNGILYYHRTYSPLSDIFKLRLADEAVKQELLDALAKEGKRWNEEKKCVEDILKPKFMSGDKVRIKKGISNKTHYNVGPGFVEDMDALIGKTMTVDEYYRNNYVKCEETYWSLREDWLEPYVEELKEGDLAIFWDLDKSRAFVGKYDCFHKDSCYPHRDNRDYVWANAVKFESEEQFKKLLKGED